MFVKHDNNQQRRQFRSVTEDDLHSFRAIKIQKIK